MQTWRSMLCSLCTEAQLTGELVRGGLFRWLQHTFHSMFHFYKEKKTLKFLRLGLQIKTGGGGGKDSAKCLLQKSEKSLVGNPEK